MRVGVLKEAGGEARVAATPATVQKIIGLGHSVVVDSGAGEGASFTDSAYRSAGAEIGSATSADIVLGVTAPSAVQLGQLRPGTLLVALLTPATNPDLIEGLGQMGLTALAMDAVPRISRAQSLDVLSSMANIAGYRAVIEAAHHFGRFFTGQVTAAGKVPPAKVLVAGAGVAGLSAIGTAGALGAIVRATDPRPEVADQVRSLGGEYLAVAPQASQTSTTGYATEMTDSYKQREADLYLAQCRDVDIVITTALIPGRPAPILVTREMVDEMRPGSVIVDMATPNGGNVEGSVSGAVIKTENGVTIIGYTDLVGRLPAQASQLYGTNVVNLLKMLSPDRDGSITLDLDDVVIRSMTVVHSGEVLWPPPPVAVSSVRSTDAQPSDQPPEASPVPAPVARRRTSLATRTGVIVLALFALSAISPPELRGHLTVFTLAVIVGFYVIGHVHHALHTPLMSVTNAISGIIVAGALVQMTHESTLMTLLASAAVFVATINVFGGFAVTRRMLAMFAPTTPRQP